MKVKYDDEFLAYLRVRLLPDKELIDNVCQDSLTELGLHREAVRNFVTKVEFQHNKPVFVYDDGTVSGYAFCLITECRGRYVKEHFGQTPAYFRRH